MDGFVFIGFPDASTVGLPDASVVVVGLPDASVEEEENMLPMLPNIPPDDAGFPDASVVGFPDASVVGFPDASLEEENGDERLNASLIEVVPFKNDFIIILFQ
jgi:hypothetical protein